MKRKKEIPSPTEVQTMELNVIYSMAAEKMRQGSSIDVIDARLDMRPRNKPSDLRRKKSERYAMHFTISTLGTLTTYQATIDFAWYFCRMEAHQEEVKLKAEIWNLERQAEDGTEEEEEETEETPKIKEEKKDEITENGKDEEDAGEAVDSELFFSAPPTSFYTGAPFGASFGNALAITGGGVGPAFAFDLFSPLHLDRILTKVAGGSAHPN